MISLSRSLLIVVCTILSIPIFSQLQKVSSLKKNKHFVYANFSLSRGILTNGIEDIDIPGIPSTYFEDLKKGINISGDLYFALNDKHNLGITLQRFRSHNQIDNMVFTDDQGNNHTGILKDDFRLLFIGPSWVSTSRSYNQDNEFSSTLSIGYHSFTNLSTAFLPVKITSESLGVFIKLAYAYYLDDNLSIGINAAYLNTTIKSYKYEFFDGSTDTIDLQEDQYEGWGRLTFGVSVGFRF